jgi:integrase
MAAKNFFKEPDEVGIYYYASKDSLGKPDKIYYISYKKDGRKIWDKIGRKSEGFTKAKIRNERSFIVSGQKLSPLDKKRQKQKEEKHTKKWTFIQLWNYYRDNHDNYKGVSKEKGRFENYIQPVFGQREPRKLKATEVDSFKRKLKNRGLSPQTIKNVLEMLKRLSNYGEKRDLCKGLQFRIEFPKVNNIKHEALSTEEIVSLLDVLDRNNSVESTIMKVILFTGRRTAEICGLEWKDINLEDQIMILKDTKPGINERLPFSDVVKSIFEGINPKDKKYVFPNAKGQKKTRVDRPARVLMLESGIPSDYRPTYCLRHTFTSFASNTAKVPYIVIQQLIGHQINSRDVTMRYLEITDKVLLDHLNSISSKILKLEKKLGMDDW